MKKDKAGKRIARVARRAAIKSVKPGANTPGPKPKPIVQAARRRPALKKAVKVKTVVGLNLAAHPPAHPHRIGFVSIAGRPNAGKSTLLNALVGEKVAIVARQAQTTRTTIQGVANVPGAQIVFVDTPGIHKSDTLFNRRMMDTVRGALEERDLVLFVADVTKPLTPEDQHAVSALRDNSRAFLVLNKIDRLEDKRLLLPLIEAYVKLRPFQEVLPISAMKGAGIDELMGAIVDCLPEGAPLFPEDHFTDLPKRFLAAELIRERVLREAAQEVPHAVAVLIDEWEEKRDLTRIAATIIVERPGQKAILIGARGAMLKKIGTDARLEIEEMLGGNVFLSVFVRVQPKWREDSQFLNTLDWRSMVGSE
jgi:GTPase